MIFADVHAHLSDSKFKDILDEVISRSEAVGVKAVITNGLGADNAEQLLLAKRFPMVRAALGLYPTEAEKLDSDGVKATLAYITENAKSIAGLGEIGLDRNRSPYDAAWKRQLYAFDSMLGLAVELKRPVLVHSRKAEREVIDILSKHDPPAVVMHCFGGRMSLVKEALDRGYYFSIPPIVRTSSHFQALVKLTDSSHLLTETDAPYLSPDENISMPSNVKVSVEEIAKLKELNEEETASIIFKNYMKVF